MIRALFLGLLLGGGPFLAASVQACAICIQMPQESVADKVIDADLVAILREDPEHAFHYRVHRVLAGASALAPPPPFLVDTAMRKKLASLPDEGALATWTNSSGWQLHGYASAVFERILVHALLDFDKWRGAGGEQARFDFFAPLHASSDPAVQELAMIELARMPYSLLRTLQPGLDRREVARRMIDPRWLEWAPIYILILGQSDARADQDFVRRAARAALTRGGFGDLAAWVTAWIEVDGVVAISAICREHLSNDTISTSDLRAIAMGLAEHSQAGEPAVAVHANQVLSHIAELHPSAAGIVARGLLAAQDWSATDTMIRQLASGAILNPDEIFSIEAYLAGARIKPSASALD